MTPEAPVQWHETIDSTNEAAKLLAQAGQYGPLWIASREQTLGRGRLGRQWASPVGNLYCTALFHEPAGVQVATRFPFAAGLAIADLCTSLVPEAPIRLKWPNDVRCEGAKLCGILVEAGQGPDQGVWVGAGMGLNVISAPEGTGQETTSLAALGASAGITAELALDALRPLFARRVAQAREDFPSLLRDWERVAEGLGQIVTVGKDEKALRGVFKGLAPDGGLQLQLPDGTEQTIRAGDVELIKEVGRATRD
ncbi:biotin--[acetyl-CoA-carboxylase] ligase [Henriciella aquimarina]|uniref:biotin--[acetyl-CoA-carboxylase] ligase n=1 Tax=Henriciella aquimarina TaxID=545261 RepID=UPI001301D387|nr:biotin--[acetyl-CoA-carboxylase] ligase [Henriciella aquimarina]